MVVVINQQSIHLPFHNDLPAFWILFLKCPDALCSIFYQTLSQGTIYIILNDHLLYVHTKTASAHSSLEPHMFCMFTAFIFLASLFPYYSTALITLQVWCTARPTNKYTKISNLLFLCCQPVHLNRRCCQEHDDGSQERCTGILFNSYQFYYQPRGGHRR